MPVGGLHENLSFQMREAQGDDGLGNTLSEWVEQFTTRAKRKFLQGGESVMAGRLQGKQPVIFTVRKSCQVDAVCPDWRIVDCRGGTVYNIRAINEGYSRLYYDILAESGVADG